MPLGIFIAIIALGYMIPERFLYSDFEGKKRTLHRLRLKGFTLIDETNKIIKEGNLSTKVVKNIEELFLNFSEIFSISLELSQLEEQKQEKYEFDEEFYLTDLRREIIGIIDHILIALDEKSKQLEQSHTDIQLIDRPLELIRIIELRKEMSNIQEKLRVMRVQFS